MKMQLATFEKVFKKYRSGSTVKVYKLVRISFMLIKGIICQCQNFGALDNLKRMHDIACNVIIPIAIYMTAE